MNLDILSHFYTVYYKSDTAEWHSYFCAVIIRGHVVDWSGAEYGISFHFFDVFLCELLYDIFLSPIRFMLIFVILQVDFVPNLDNSQKEPSLLPACISSLLLNDSSGIAVWVCIHFIQVLLSQIFIYAKMGFLQLFKLFQVGMATNIPPHNLGSLLMHFLL